MIDAREYAQRLGVDLYEEYSTATAAKLCRIGADKLRQAKRNGDIEYMSIGERSYKFLGEDLIRWKLKMRRTCAETTTSPKTEAEHGAAHGIAQRPDRESLQALALKTFS